MKISSSLVLIIGLFLSGGQAFAMNHHKVFSEGRLDLEGVGSYYKTTSNFTSSGTTRDLSSGNSFQLIDVGGGTRYGLSDEMNLFAGFNIGSAESKGLDATRSNSTLNKIDFGGEILWNLPGFDLIPEFKGTMALEKVSETQDTVMNNEGVNEYTGKLNIQFDYRSFLLFGYGGYTYREKGRSSLLPWGVNAEFMFSGFNLGGEIFGFQSLGADKDKGTDAELAREAIQSQVNGGSARFYSVNPNVIDTNIYLKLVPWPGFTFWMAGGLPLTGTNYANGFHFEGGLRFTFGAVTESRHHSLSRPVDDGSRLSTDKKVERFKEDTADGVNQEIFRPTPTPRPIPKPPKASVTDRQLKNQMNDVEMEIELKANKKRRR